MLIPLLTAGLITCAIAVSLVGYLVVQLHIEVKAMKSSTHQVQYVRTDEFDKLTEETKKILEKELFDNIN